MPASRRRAKRAADLPGTSSSGGAFVSLMLVSVYSGRAKTKSALPRDLDRAGGWIKSSDCILVTHPGPLMAKPAVMKNLKLEKLSGLDFRWHPEHALTGPMSIVISEADRQVVIFAMADLRLHIVVAPAFRDFAQAALQTGRAIP